MFAIYSTKKETQNIINGINNSSKWTDGITNNYANPIALENGNFAIQVLSGYEKYFGIVVNNIVVKNIKMNY